MALAGLGITDQARDEVQQVLAIDPAFREDPVAVFTRYANLTEAQIGTLLRHLELFREPAAS